VDRVIEDIAARGRKQIPHGLTSAREDKRMAVEVPRGVDSLYLGGGTPTLLQQAQLERLFTAIRENFEQKQSAEVTVECAPGTLSPEVIDSLLRCGVNRVSLGVQSFIDKEASSVARLHTREVTLDEIGCLRAAGIDNINIDLIAGLPHQTLESWDNSLSQLIDTGVPHASVYMLEVDEDSRLGRELIAGGTKYHAHSVPDEDLTADLYEHACDRLNRAGIAQYEISNFARPGHQSTHNLKYWTRQPYLGFGVDAHSMLLADPGSQFESLRFATTDNLEQYVEGTPLTEAHVTQEAAIEEAFFLGLRLTCGIKPVELATRYGTSASSAFRDELVELATAGLVEFVEDRIRLTSRGRLLSNEVFARIVGSNKAVRA
jgi:oxygen-independent coproporphyrinogen-3 oxidase